MTRKRARSQQISSDERKKNNIFTKRVESLSKKTNDLSILCGVDVGMVIHKPAENNAVLWPSPQIFSERMHKFLAFSESERAKKMVLHDEYLEERLNNEKEAVVKSRKEKQHIESHSLMNELLITQAKTFHDVDLVQLNDLQSFTTEMLKKLQERGDVLDTEEEL